MTRHRTVLLLSALAVVLLAGGAVALRGRTAKGLEWAQVTPGGDCRCADGSTFNFWQRRADPARVVLFLNGGGVCWDAKMCAFTSTDSEGENDSYGWNLSSVDPENRSGMFDTTRSENPFADYSFLYVSSCTGDAHLGDATRKYSADLTVEHHGYVNGTAALNYLAEHYPNAEQVVVVGKTAGSVAAPIYGGLVADRLPKAQVVVFGAQSGAWPNNPDFNADILDARWGAYHAVPGWAVDGLGVRDWGVPRFWTQAARRHPNLVLARFDFAYDPHATSELTRWLDGNPPDLLAQLDRNEAAIEAAGVRLHSFTAPGADHQIFEPDKFYELEVKGVRLVDWLKALVTGTPPADVHCDQCGP
jgi:hypothetical protein